LFECLEVFAPFYILCPDVANERTDPVYVVGQAHHTDYFYENQAKGLLICSGVEIAESHCKHYIDSPVVSPDVLFKPRSILDTSKLVPIVCGIYIRHGGEEDGEYMSEAKVEEHNLNQRPILLVMIVLNEANFQFLHFLRALRQLRDNKQPNIHHKVPIRRYIDH
jgi:hypothetical protein